MALVKLDSGDYINTDKIEIISKTENINTGKNSTFVMPRSGLYALISNSNTVNLTTSDRDRIVEAMTKPETELRERLAGLIQQLNARIKELEPQMRPENISERLTLETIVQWMSEALDE